MSPNSAFCARLRVPVPCPRVRRHHPALCSCVSVSNMILRRRKHDATIVNVWCKLQRGGLVATTKPVILFDNPFAAYPILGDESLLHNNCHEERQTCHCRFQEKNSPSVGISQQTPSSVQNKEHHAPDATLRVPSLQRRPTQQIIFA